MSKFAYKIALCQVGYVAVVDGAWTGEGDLEDLAADVTRKQSIDEMVEARLRDAGCPNELEFLTALGEEGWELVTIVRDVPGTHWMYFRKPLD